LSSLYGNMVGEPWALRAVSCACTALRFADGGFQGFPGSGMLAELCVNDTFSFIVVDGEWSFANKFKSLCCPSCNEPRQRSNEANSTIQR
jgi:hypothetical protein